MKIAGADGRLHIAFTDGHPRDEEANSIYYVGYRDGEFVTANGSRIASDNDLPLDPSEVDCVFDTVDHGARAWVWDVACDDTGMPTVVFSVFRTEDEHVYYYGRWDGKEWAVHRIVYGGRWLPEDVEGRRQSETYYSGGVVLDHANVDVVYLSRQIDGVFEIERWETENLGATWSSEAITSRSTYSNVRPVSIRGHGASGPQILWMQIDGKYIGYKDYRTSIRIASLQQ